MTPSPVVAIVGPTASGKTACALALADHLAASGERAEIVSMDSALVYRGLDIGTAKPGAAERAAVPHHLIDIREPTEAYSAAAFAQDAARLVEQIQARGARPLVVGGTLLYWKALTEGLHELPPADPAVREALAAEARERGWSALHAELARIDPATAARLAPHDAQRVQRALEVWRATGKPLSAWHSATKSAAGRGDSAVNYQVFSLEPRERAWLHARVAARFGAMLDQGLVAEVEHLRARGDLHADLPSMRCVGYRQVWDTLEGRAPLSTLLDRGVAATRQLAKRQLTWLRGMPDRQVLACDDPQAPGQLVARALSLLGARQGHNRAPPC